MEKKYIYVLTEKKENKEASNREAVTYHEGVEEALKYIRSFMECRAKYAKVRDRGGFVGEHKKLEESLKIEYSYNHQTYSIMFENWADSRDANMGNIASPESNLDVEAMGYILVKKEITFSL